MALGLAARLSYFALLFAVFALPVGVHAQAASAVVRDDGKARAVFEAARDAYERGRFTEALALFERAYSLSGRSELLFNVGRAAEADGDEARAIAARRIARVRRSHACACFRCTRVCVSAWLARSSCTTRRSTWGRRSDCKSALGGCGASSGSASSSAPAGTALPIQRTPISTRTRSTSWARATSSFSSHGLGYKLDRLPLELYGALPHGLALSPWLGGEYDTDYQGDPGLSVGVLIGGSYFFAEHFGINAETGVTWAGLLSDQVQLSEYTLLRVSATYAF